MGPLCTDANNCGAQGHSCLGGTCANGACQPFSLGQTFPANQLTLDASNVYAGFELPQTQGQPCSGSPRIASISRTTATMTTVVPCGAIAGEGDNTDALVLVGNALDWSMNLDPNDAAIGELYTVPTQGGTPAALGVSNSAPEPAADSTYLYYRNTVGPGGLTRVKLDGTGLMQLDPQSARYITLDDTNVYFTTDPCFQGEDEGCDTPASIHVVAKTGGTSQTLVASAPNAFHLVVQDGYLYWREGNNAGTSIRRMPTSGGQPETIVSDTNMSSFVVDATSVYWTRTPSGIAQYDVMTETLAGRQPRVLYSDAMTVKAITGDATAFVWSTFDGKLWLLAK